MQLVEVVRGRPAIGERYVQMQRDARREVRCFDARPNVSREPQVNTLELDLLRRGVRYRSSTTGTGSNCPGGSPTSKRGWRTASRPASPTCRSSWC